MTTALGAFAALSQTSRLAIYRLLVEAGVEGLPVAAIAGQLNLANATLSFHIKELVNAGLIEGKPQGRWIIYSARFERMNELIGFLTENCCQGKSCAPLVNAVKRIAINKRTIETKTKQRKSA